MKKCWKITCETCKEAGETYRCTWYSYTRDDAFRKLENLKSNKGVFSRPGYLLCNSEKRFKVWYHDSWQWVPFGPEKVEVPEGVKQR